MKKSELSLFLSCLLLSTVMAWLLFGVSWQTTFAGIALGAAGYAISSIIRLRRISHWLEYKTDSEPPDSVGEYGDVLDKLHRMRSNSMRQAESAEQRIVHLQNSFASLDEAVILLNDAGEIDWSNQAAERLFGLQFPEDQGRALVTLIRAPEFLIYFDAGDYEQPLAIAAPMSEPGQLEISITWFGIGNRMVFVRDVTEVRRLEQIRTDFIANVSHELRTPLTVISGYLEAMQDSESEWHAALQQMSSQAERMESLLTDLTQLNKLESVVERSQHDVLDVKNMISMMFDGISVQKPEQTLEIKQKTDAQLLGNRDELYSAFSNLINNASKYSGDTGKIVVTWKLDATGASLIVTDTGVGIEAQHLPRLTERFYRADPGRHRSTGGTGLGLAIVKHVLLRHQAALKIESTPGQGSTFTCLFPEERVVRPKAQN
ncbi:MAG: phosphate regulon sensor histidine kinase PhoR [Pseudomonadales bacterium]